MDAGSRASKKRPDSPDSALKRSSQTSCCSNAGAAVPKSLANRRPTSQLPSLRPDQLEPDAGLHGSHWATAEEGLHSGRGLGRELCAVKNSSASFEDLHQDHQVGWTTSSSESGNSMHPQQLAEVLSGKCQECEESLKVNRFLFTFQNTTFSSVNFFVNLLIRALMVASGESKMASLTVADVPFPS